VTWDGVTARGLIDDQVVVEGSSVHGGVFFERGLDGLWRGRLGSPTKATMKAHTLQIDRKNESPFGIRVERGDVCLDSIWSKRLVTENAVAATMESTIRLESPEAVMRLGWGDPRIA
jgi:hypothetical protein